MSTPIQPNLHPELTEAIAKATRSVEEFSQALGKHAIPAFKQAIEAMEQMRPFLEALQERYREAGAPYGDTSEGFRRWMQDLGELMAHQRAIDDIHQRHQAIAKLRQQQSRWSV